MPAPAPAADAAVPPAPAPIARGGACTRESRCGDGMFCGPFPGGYCASFCGLTGTACPDDGRCIETARAGELCAKGCTADAECRVQEGYLCDPVWHACLIPNVAAIVPKQCPAPAGEPHDKTFAASEPLSTAAAPGIYQFEPSAVVLPDGDLVAMYIARGAIDAGNPLGVAHTGKTRVLDVPFTSDRGSHFDPWLARDSKGVIYAVWLGFDGRSEHQQIGFASSKDGGATWSKPVGVEAPGDCPEDTEDCIDKPMIVSGPKDELYVMYAAGDGLRVRGSRDHGATWSPAVTPLTGIYGNAAVGADGRLHIVTLNGGPMGAFGSADQKIEYAVSADGGKTFTKPQTLSGRDEKLPFFFANPSVALDARRGWIYVAYTRGGRDAVWDLVILASKDKGKTWKRTRIGDDPACAIHMVPNLAVDPTTGTLHVAWYDSRGTVGRFAHATCAPGAATCVQRGAINDVPFAALSTERHGAKWIGEYETLAVDARRRLLHAVWAQPVAEGDKVVTRIFHATAKLPAR